jgi:fructose-1,6-bisphosphatase II
MLANPKRVKYQLSTPNLGLDLMRATEAAAMAAGKWAGRGQKEAGDQAAVDAMREVLNGITMRGVVVIGEGEKDEAPMLANGETVGKGGGTPVHSAGPRADATTLLAAGMPNAIAVIAASDRGTMYDPSAVFYMEKLVVGPDAADAVDLDAPVADNIAKVAKAKGVGVEDITVGILNRTRHEPIIADIRAAGAKTRLFPDGDVAISIAAAEDGHAVDMMVGTGGTPEGVITACAMKAMGGMILGRMAPRDDAEREKARDAGLDVSQVLTTDDLVKGGHTFFVATGITDGDLLQGVRYFRNGARTSSIVMRSRSGTVRYVESVHRIDKVRGFAKGTSDGER